MKDHERHAANVALIGDIHGCSAELAALLEAVGGRAIVSLGDVLDRGPDPEGCLRLLRDRDAAFVLGNHEEKHLRWRSHEAKARRSPSYRNPIRLAPHHVDTQRAVSEESWRWLEERTVPFLRVAGHEVVAVHAGLQAGVAPEAHAHDRICRVQLTKPNTDKSSPWGSFRLDPDGVPRLVGPDVPDALARGYRWWTEFLGGGDVVVYGHSVFSRPFATYRRADAIEHRFLPDDDVPSSDLVALGIDTGAPFGGALTALLLPEWKTVRIDAKRQYFSRDQPEN